MPASPLDIKLSKYWALLSPGQKKSLLEVIHSFIQTPETKAQELQESEPFYKTGDSGFPVEVLQQLTSRQKEALIILIASFHIDAGDERISIEQYNKELDEAEAEFERGEVITHKEMIAMSKKWIQGK
jgi:hypothetical protein